MIWPKGLELEVWVCVSDCRDLVTLLHECLEFGISSCIKIVKQLVRFYYYQSGILEALSSDSRLKYFTSAVYFASKNVRALLYK